ARLLASIAERGIQEPLSGVDTPQGRLLREVKTKTLNILEQAKFVVELLSMHDMSVAEVAETLSRSKAWVRLGGSRVTVIASLLYLRYSKRRYLRFYRAFNRFAMKCFFHEALMFWGFAAGRCIIDNTNLARLRGAGGQAIIVPEMRAFSRRYGFEFACHAIGHANRKAGEERSFWTVETNFFPGRTFDSLEDLNQQALQWATERMEHRPQGKSRLIPAVAFDHERFYLHALPEHLPAPYQMHPRRTDQYGYAAFGANYYWVPGRKREDVKVLQYADRLKLFQHHECLAEYPLPTDGVRDQYYSPPGQPRPRHQPNNRRREARQEEQRLRAIGADVGDDFRQRPAYQEGCLTDQPDLSVYDQLPEEHEEEEDDEPF
ncbi:MAG: hypothetical protein ACE5E5_16175, partial [Phycisphaerae bacterium]